MNPVLIVLLLIGCVMLWLLCSFLFQPIGRILKKLLDDAKESMFEEEKGE